MNCLDDVICSTLPVMYCDSSEMHAVHTISVADLGNMSLVCEQHELTVSKQTL
jgi:hypothetical protein